MSVDERKYGLAADEFDAAITNPDNQKFDSSSREFSDDVDVHGPLHTTSKSIGVRRSEVIIAENSNWITIGLLAFSVFAVAYSYSLDATLRYTLQSYATSSYSQHSLLATVNVIKSVMAAASQPAYARLSDRFGRFELFVVALVFYATGTVIESQAYDVNRFAGGAVLYQLGYSGVIVMIEIMLADFSTLNWRLVASFIPALPFIINTWVSADILASLNPTTEWSWDIGMWAFIFPLTCIPYLAVLLYMTWKASKTPEWKQINEDAKVQHPFWVSWKKNVFVDVFWEIDVIGILFIICIFGFILTPFTIAGGVREQWHRGAIIAPLVIGFVLIPFFIWWEKLWATYPIVPFPLLKDRGVWSALIIAVFINWIWYMPNDYMYPVLLVGMRQTIKSALRITSLYSFVSVITGPILGLVIVKVRKTKPFIIFGVSTWMVALGLMIHYRGSNDGIASEKYVNGVIGALCLMGFGAGFYTYTTQVSIATCTNHEHMAVIISLYLASYNIGSAFGSAVSGAIWSNLMYKRIVYEMGRQGITDTAIATEAYGSPYTFILTYTWGTPARIAVALAYAHVQRILCIVGVCLCVPLMLAALFLRNHKLESVQSLESNHVAKGIKENGEVVVNNYDNDPVFNVINKLNPKKLFGK